MLNGLLEQAGIVDTFANPVKVSTTLHQPRPALEFYSLNAKM